LSDELIVWKELIPVNDQIELWKSLVLSDTGRPFLVAAATAHGYSVSEGNIIDEAGRPINSSSPDWDAIITDAARQAQVEKPMENWK
tara:strand:- start:2793 stop:3053 length:261 start_codon:yes stop_codon:yes gene_type:complete